MGFKGFNGEVEFSMGYVLGVRGFKLDTMGRFTGWSFESVWTPGENVAVCRSRKLDCTSLDYLMGRSSYSHVSTHVHRDSCYTPDPCDGDIEKCDHGFWAYFDDFDGQGGDSLASKTYAAIIKGYGKTVIGSKGFRSEKAEILAAVVPNTYMDAILPRAMVQRNYPDIRLFDSKEEMFAAYPAQDQTPKQPTDPKDPAFWTFDPASTQKTIRRLEQQKVKI